MLHYFFISELTEPNFCKNSFLVTFGPKSPQNMVFWIFMEILPFDFPKSSLKGKLLWYLTSDPGCSQLIRSQDSRKYNISKWIETWISKKGFKMYCVKSVRIRSYSGPHTDTFYAVIGYFVFWYRLFFLTDCHLISLETALKQNYCDTWLSHTNSVSGVISSIINQDAVNQSDYRILECTISKKVNWDMKLISCIWARIQLGFPWNRWNTQITSKWQMKEI